MNKEQLEKMRQKIEEIKELLGEDTAASIDVELALDSLEAVVVKELQHELWTEYNENRRKKELLKV